MYVLLKNYYSGNHLLLFLQRIHAAGGRGDGGGDGNGVHGPPDRRLAPRRCSTSH